MAAWANTVDAGEKAARKYGADTYFAVSYERIVADPEPELRSLCAFLGEEFDLAMLRPNEMAGAAVPERKSWHVNTSQAINADRVGRWKELEQWELGLAESVIGSRLKAHSYELSREGTRPPLKARIEFRRQLLGRKRAMRRRQKLAHAGDTDLGARLTSRERL
jgi:hypothetical protein